MYEGAPGYQNPILKPKSLVETLPMLCLGNKHEIVNGRQREDSRLNSSFTTKNTATLNVFLPISELKFVSW